MRRLSIIATLATAGIFLLLSLTPCFGETGNYLIIKKKDGGTVKVPLKVAPDQIEGLDVELGPPGAAPQAGPGQRQGPESAESPNEPAPERAVEKPQQMGEEPLIPLRGQERQPAATQQPQAPASRGPAQAERPPSQETQAAPEGGGPRKSGIPLPSRESGPAPQVGGLGELKVNVYKLPDGIQALPDYSAFMPKDVISTQQINLMPSEGLKEPANIPQDPKGLGLRFMGLFRVRGEGIFRWRINSKDGVRFHIDDKTLIENDGIHPAASKTGFIHLSDGIHVLVLDSFNSKGAPVLQLFVTPPTGPEELFSASDGLVGWKQPEKPYDVLWGQVYFVPTGKYPKGPDWAKISPIGRLISRELDISGSGGIPGLPGRKDMVGIRYEGYFSTKGAGIFAFRLKADDYAKLTIGKDTIATISGSNNKDSEGEVGWAFLQEGSYPISLDYFHANGDINMGLFVTEPNKQERVFAPAAPLVGYDAKQQKANTLPAFVYFLKPGTKKLPNYNDMTPSGMFFSPAIDFPVDRGSRDFPGVPRRTEWLGIRFYVQFTLNEKEKGLYKFRLIADDGAKLIVGKKLVINADGYGGKREKSGSVTLPVGTHEMFLDYYQAKGDNGLQLFITPPNQEEKIFSFQ